MGGDLVVSWLDRLASAWGAPNPSLPERCDLVAGDPRRVAEVQEVLDEMRPMFQADAGDVELVSIEDGWIVVRLHGACRGCHASDTTLHGALEPSLRARLNWVVGVRTG